MLFHKSGSVVELRDVHIDPTGIISRKRRQAEDELSRHQRFSKDFVVNPYRTPRCVFFGNFYLAISCLWILSLWWTLIFVFTVSNYNSNYIRNYNKISLSDDRWQKFLYGSCNWTKDTIVLNCLHIAKLLPLLISCCTQKSRLSTCYPHRTDYCRCWLAAAQKRVGYSPVIHIGQITAAVDQLLHTEE